MTNVITVLFVLMLVGCTHSEKEKKEKPIMVVTVEKPQDWLIGRKIQFIQRDNDILVSRPEKPIHYLGYKNPDKIAVKIGMSLYYLPKVAAVTMPSDFLKDFQEVDTKTEFTIIGSYTRRMSDWQERMWPLIYRMLIVQDTNGQKYVVYEEILSRQKYPDMFTKERRPK